MQILTHNQQNVATNSIDFNDTYYRVFHKKDKPELKRPLPYSDYVRTSYGKLIGSNDEDLNNYEIKVEEDIDEVRFYRLSNTAITLHWLEEWSIMEGYPLYSYSSKKDKLIEGKITAIVLTTKEHIFIKLDGYKEVMQIKKKIDEDDIVWIEPLLTHIEIKELVDFLTLAEYKSEVLNGLIIYNSAKIIENNITYDVGQKYLTAYSKKKEELQKEIDEIPF